MRTQVFMLTPLAWACVAAFAQTLPTGGTITQGAGSVTVNGGGMVVNQATPRMVADWQSFSIGAGNSVRFVQPSSNSVALNRVLGSDPSRIFGSLSANGHVYLQNPNGVLFAPGAQVDVGSLVATTLRADVGEFVAGRLRLSAADIASGSVVNEGTIVTAPGGHVVLAGPQVSNAGSITTPRGTTALVAAGAVDVDPTGSGLLSIRVPVAAVNAQLTHSGTISADGGAVLLQAAAANAARRTVMQVDGIVRARSIEERDGQIVLAGGSSGIVALTGALDASGGADIKGGSVKVLGDRVALLGNATIDASGGAGGGTVLVGGNWQGHGPEANAQATLVGSGVKLDASARERGDGGTVVVWSDGATTFGGQIDARGGAAGGDGGRVEVSGKQLLNFVGSVDTRAPAGREGSLLLDPFNLEIGTTANIDGIAPAGDDLTAANLPLLYGDFGFAPNSQITAGAVATLLATTDVLLQASNSINVIAPIDVAGGGAATTLTLNSPTITVAATAPMSLSNAALVLDTDFGLSDTIRINAPITSLRSVALTSTDIGINAVITAPAVTLSSNGVVNEGAGGGIVATAVTALQLAEGSADLNLTSANNRIGSLTLQNGNADVQLNNAVGTSTSVQGSVFGDFTIATTGGLTQAGALTVSADTQITTTGTDAAVLTNAGNLFTGPLNFATAAGITLAAQGPLQITGSGAGDVRVTVTGGSLRLGTPGIATTGALIDLTSAGFVNLGTAGTALLTGAGGRFFIRSSDFSADALGSIGFGTGANDVNHIVLGGWTGATPAAGNVYLTNAVGTITTPVGDAAAVSKVYDGSTAFTYTQTGAAATGLITTTPGATVPLSSYTLNAAGTFADKNVGIDKAYTVAASADVVGSGSGGEQYYGFSFAGFSRPAGPGVSVPLPASVVTPRAITSSGITGVDRVYDGTTVVALSTGAAALTGAVAGDGVTLTTSGAAGAVGDKNVGVAKPVLVSGLTLAGVDAGNYTLTDASGATATITPRPITSSGLTAVNRVYDGTTAVALSAAGASLAGTVAGDTVSVSGGTGTTADKNVGTAKPVTVSAVTLAGTDAGNYTVTDTSAPTVDIAVRTITSTGVAGVDRVYDGTTTVGVDASGATLTNAVAGDAVSISTAAASGTMSDKNVGTAKPVAVSGLALAGADAANYSLVDASGTTVDITPLGLTPAGITAVNRVVDGTTTVTLNTGGATVVGVLSGDVVGVDASGAVGSVATPDPGVAKPVTVSGLALTGADAVNYSILATPIGPTGEGLTVRILSVSAAEFEAVRFKEYLQGVSDAQEPFRRAMAEALAAGFGKENIRKQLTRGLVFETGLAPPAVDTIEPAAKPASCTAASGLACGK